MVARRFFLLVTALLFFIHDDEADIFERRENRGACTDYHAGFAISNAPPFARAFDVTQGGVKNGHALEARAEPGTALAANPERESDFRDEDDGGFSAGQRVLDRA